VDAAHAVTLLSSAAVVVALSAFSLGFVGMMSRLLSLSRASELEAAADIELFEQSRRLGRSSQIAEASLRSPVARSDEPGH